jgi:hypothetical protein
MKRLSSPGFHHARAVVPVVLAHGPTAEQLVAAEMYLASLAPSPQVSLFNTAPPTRESCPVVVPSLQAGRRGPFVGR